MSVQQEVLGAAQRLCRERGTRTFSPEEIVRALPHLNPRTVRTHIVSRCCVNAPAHHGHRWPYFRRTGRAAYELAPPYRTTPRGERGQKPPDERPAEPPGKSSDQPASPGLRDVVHVFINKDGPWYVAECAEVAVVTQGRTLDEVVTNLREALALHLEGGDAAALGFIAAPRLIVTIELRPADAVA